MRFLESLRRRKSRSSDEERPARLCTVCENLSLSQLLTFPKSFHRTSPTHDLVFADIKSQRRSCDFCGVLYDAVTVVCEKLCSNHDKQLQSIVLSAHARGQIRITVQGRDLESYAETPFAQSFYLQNIASDLEVGETEGTLRDMRCINLEDARAWLTTCDEKHGKECRSAIDQGFVSRPKGALVVDVRQMCLVQLPPDAKYATLSYVWGGVQLLHLRQDNSDALRQPGSLNRVEYAGDLPATIRDAIEVAKAIGLQYVWIDSLCIPQDQPHETATQVANMHNIFGSAHLTIIAADGKSADSGLQGLPSRRRDISYGVELVPTQSGKPIVCAISSDKMLGLVRVHSSLKNVRGFKGDIWNVSRPEVLPWCHELRETAWSTRAWTFQEGLLSSRALVFMDGQVFWHCPKNVWCEALLGRRLDFNGFALDYRYDHLDNLASSSGFQHSWGTYDASIELKRDGRTLVVCSEAFSLYKATVGAYTPRRLGRSQDRLAAFDGISRILGQCFKSSLLYGLPESLLDLALLWRPCSPRFDANDALGFPSWSWATWHDAISYSNPFGIQYGRTRELFEHESGEERMRPLVRWYKTGKDDMFQPINDCGIGIKDALGTEGLLPNDWEGVLGPDQTRKLDLGERSPSPQFLRCYTMTAKIMVGKSEHFRPLDVAGASLLGGQTDKEYAGTFRTICNRYGQVIGEVMIDNELFGEADPSACQVDFITLSEAQFFRFDELNTESKRGNLYESPFAYTLYNVMAVSWSSDGRTAYRKGIGSVFQEDWHKEDMDFQWVNLG